MPRSITHGIIALSASTFTARAPTSAPTTTTGVGICSNAAANGAAQANLEDDLVVGSPSKLYAETGSQSHR